MAYWVQGSWDRIGGGASTGYPAFASFRTFEHFRSTIGALVSERFVALLALPALLALAIRPWARAYLYFFSMILAFVVLVVTGFFGLHYRYIAASQAIFFALGCGGLGVLHASLRDGGPSGSIRGWWPWAATALALVALGLWAAGELSTPLTMLAIPAAYGLTAALNARRAASRLPTLCHAGVCALLAGASILAATQLRRDIGDMVAETHPAILDGREFLEQPVVPRGASVLAEDETLNYVFAKAPDYVGGARSIQSFNVMTESERRRTLERTDYLYVSLRQNHGWNYLFYFPRLEWRDDPFRIAVNEMLVTRRGRELLGVEIAPVYHSDTRFVATVGAR